MPSKQAVTFSTCILWHARNFVEVALWVMRMLWELLIGPRSVLVGFELVKSTARFCVTLYYQFFVLELLSCLGRCVYLLTPLSTKRYIFYTFYFLN